MEDNNQTPNRPDREPTYQATPYQAPNSPPPSYQPPYPNYPARYEDDRPLTIGNYLVLMIVGAIPVVGLIMLLIWAFSGSSNTNRKNYARASLIVMLIAVVLSLIFGTTIAGIIRSMPGGGFSGGI